eukprot:s1587_g2.t1
MTEDLLQEMTQQIALSGHELSFIAGDFNQLYESMTEPKKWEAMGWREIQHIAWERWCVPPVATCKRTSRKDFLFLSPALQKFVHSVSNSWEHFADHSILSAILAFPTVDLRKACWPKPQVIQYEDKTEVAAIQQMEVEPINAQASSDSVYAAIFEQFEHGVHEVKRKLGKPGLSHAQYGRGKTKQRTFQKCQVAPLKASRQGEPNPSFDGLNLRYKRWFVQLRRLIAYRNLVNLDRSTPTAIEHKCKLWKSILLAPGFPKSFSLWWPTRATKLAQDAQLVPNLPPAIEVAQYCLDQFQLELHHLEKVLKSRKQEMQVTRYQADANQIFRDVRKQSPEPVNVLLAKETSVVTEVTDACTVTLDIAGRPVANKTWQSKQGAHVVTEW